MSKIEEDILKDLFQGKFNDHRTEVESENWNFVAARLDKQRFYRFSLTRFNVYYASLIVLIFLISLFSLWQLVKQETSSSELKSSITPSRQYKTITDTIISVEGINENGRGIQLNKDAASKYFSSSVQRKNNKGQDSTEVVPGIESNKNELSPEPVSADKLLSKDSISTSVPVIVPAPKKKEKKTIYVIKQDTIIKVDTLRPKSDRKKK